MLSHTSITIVSIPTMDQDTARIGAQQLDHESPKREIPPNLEEKISVDSAPASSRPSVAGPSIEASNQPGEHEKHDVETAQREIPNPAPVKVPHSKRRGLFGRFTIVAEVEEPKHYPRRTKWFITFVIAAAAVAAPLGSAIIFRKLDHLS